MKRIKKIQKGASKISNQANLPFSTNLKNLDSEVYVCCLLASCTLLLCAGFFQGDLHTVYTWGLAWFGRPQPLWIWILCSEISASVLSFSPALSSHW